MAITTQMRTDVANLYVSLFGRAPERDGLGFWVQQMDAGATMAQVAQSMYETAPARNTYPTYLTNEEIVVKFYTNVLGRTPDAEGKAFWTNKLNEGAAKGELIAEMIAAVQSYAGTDAAALASKALLANKVDVGLWYAVDQGGNDVTAASAILSSVTSAASSVTAVKTGTSTGTVGQTFALTSGVDTITGTGNNDTINAYASGVTAAGANATTLGANDVIDGGAGTDTLNIEVLSAVADGTAARNATIQGTIKNVERVFITNAADLGANLDVTTLGTAVTEAWEVTSAKNVTAVTNQVVGFKNVADANVSVTYGATQATGTVALDNSAAATGLTLTGAALKTVTVQGSVKAANATTAGTVNLTDGTVADTITTLNLNLTSAAIVNVDNLDALTTVNGAGSTGAITLAPTAAATPATTLKSITTGSGADTVTIGTTTSATVAATVDTGAGNDKITVSTTGTGTTTVKAGDGDDTITFTRALNVKDVVDGGTGTDTLSIVGTSLIAEDYEVIKAVVTGADILKFSQAMVGADASKLAQFQGFSVTTDVSSITKLADAQTVETTGDVTLSTSGYIAKGAGTPAATATTYAGTLNVTASGGVLDADAVTVGNQTDYVVTTASAANVNLTVKATAATAAAAGTASFASLTGDVQTATVTLVNSVNAVTTAVATGDAVANFNLTTATTQNGTNEFTALGNLTSLTLNGNGAATISAGVGSKLATIDASGMTGVAAYDATKQVGGLTFTGATATAETIKLGGGKDLVTTSSTYDKMDIISGLNLVKAADGTLDTAKSDDLSVGGVTNFAKTTVTGSTLGLALIDAASKAGDSLVFQYGGDTYVFVDATGAGTLQDADVVVKLTGTVDLDLLVLALNA